MTQLHGTGGVADQTHPADAKIWITLTGLPLNIKLDWPFHLSTSGADFWVLHGDIRLAGTEGFRAPVAVNLSQTVREVMTSLDAKDAEAPVINALRKEVDRRQIEFLKSGKLLPVPFSSRHYDFKRQQWVFGKATDEVMTAFLERKVYWETKLGEPNARVWIADPADAQYVQTTCAHLLEIASGIAAEGLVSVEGEYAEATPALMRHAERYEDARREALETLEKKHAFERG